MKVNFLVLYRLKSYIITLEEIMATIINFPDGKEIATEDKKNKTEIVHEVGEEVSILFKKDKVILTYPPNGISKDEFWMMVSSVVFLYNEEEGYDDMRMLVLKDAIASGFPFAMNYTDEKEDDFVIEFDPDFDLD
tara:strand:- start:153 stop:557 length:405 start_codon:yes stop_codon:yes gene_type:complete